MLISYAFNTKKEWEHISENTITKAGEMLTFGRASVKSSLALLCHLNFHLPLHGL